MKNFKNMLHILISIASVFGFLGGWATLAHSLKPTQPVSAQGQAILPLPALAPLPSMNLNPSTNNNAGSVQQFTIIAPAPSLRSRPVFRTSGS